MKAARVLIYDIETSLQLVANFDLRDEFVPHTNVIVERHLICAAWRWLGDKQVQTVSLLDDPKRYARDPHDDYHVVKTLHDVLSEADCIVAHYGDRFDKPMIDARILYHGLPALAPVASIDTYKVVKNRFRLNSNKLDYIGRYLGLGGKINTPSDLWLRILKGDKRAIRTMVTYNKRDVTLLEAVFKKLIPYIPNHLNRELFGGSGCPRCGSSKIQSRGVHKAIARVYRRWQCQSCTGWFKSTKAEPGTAKFRII
jgi:hypothetical protein